MSNGAHPGFTRTNLQTAGASLGREAPKRTPFNGFGLLPSDFTLLPSQEVGPGTEPLLYAAADAGAVKAAITVRAGGSGWSGATAVGRRAAPATPPPRPGSGPRRNASRVRLCRPEFHVHGDVEAPGMDGERNTLLLATLPGVACTVAPPCRGLEIATPVRSHRACGMVTGKVPYDDVASGRPHAAGTPLAPAPARRPCCKLRTTRRPSSLPR